MANPSTNSTAKLEFTSLTDKLICNEASERDCYRSRAETLGLLGWIMRT
jgi:hypothetical protein